MKKETDLSLLNYNELNDSEKVIFNHIDSALSSYNNTVSIPLSKITGAYSLEKAYGAARIECTNSLILPSKYTYSKDTKNLTIHFTFYISKENAKESVKIVNKEIKRIASVCLSSCKTDYEKELFIHDYLADTVTYTHETFIEDNSEYNEFGALVEHRAVCSGIAKATRALLISVGVDCGCVSNDDHMWNIVNIEGENYNLDVTWDIKEDCRMYTYFNINDKMIMKDHNILYGPSCSSDEYYWYNVNNVNLSIIEEVVELIVKAVNKKQTLVTFRLAGLDMKTLNKKLNKIMKKTKKIRGYELTCVEKQSVFRIVFTY